MKKIISVAMFLSFLLLLVGCGSASPLDVSKLNPSTLTVPFNVTVDSAQYRMSTSNMQGIAMFSLRGDSLEPDFYISITERFLSFELLFKDGKLYRKDSSSNNTNWEEIPSSLGALNGILRGMTTDYTLSPLNLGRDIFNGISFGLNLTDDMKDWQFVANETVRGVTVKRYTRQFDASTAIFWSTIKGYLNASTMNVIYNLWLDESGGLQQFNTTMMLYDGRDMLNVSIEMTFDYQSSVNMPAPQ